MTAEVSTNHDEDGWISLENDENYKIMLDLMEINRNTETPNLLEMETLYANPPRKGTLLKLLWVKGEAVGFFILRLKGFQEDSQFPFFMNILDGAYIRKAFRKQGWGSAILTDITRLFPDEDLGFSNPISVSLKHVLKKFLLVNPTYRARFWSIKNFGEEGDRLNLWFSLAEIKK